MQAFCKFTDRKSCRFLRRAAFGRTFDTGWLMGVPFFSKKCAHGRDRRSERYKQSTG